MVNLLACRAHAQFSRSSRKHTGWNFHARSLPFFIIWPNYDTCTIWCDSMIANFLSHAHALDNSLALLGAHRLQFSHATASNICHLIQLGYLCDFARSQHGRSFSTRVRMHKFPKPPESTSVGIFARNRFSSLSFGLIRVLVRFRVILRWSIF